MSEFHVDLSGEVAGPDVASTMLQRIENAIYDLDPAAVIDFTPATTRLRVAAVLDRDHLASLLVAAGCLVPPDAITQLPSICCGGCSG